ncbi:MAG: hypothetical protein ONB44_08650 [candidate division KSB1 bacterium]|nr:hypothetical protein [candidate division KSB1 bacterium]MDZ7302199.1 hypothetical protein [candidate division KSB1 bacterium]MDZ7311308.1 hypothetical protein [candidate division KSB1 bacterium]
MRRWFQKNHPQQNAGALAGVVRPPMRPGARGFVRSHARKQLALQSRLRGRMDEAFREIQSLVERAQQQHEAGTTEIASRLEALQQRRQRLVEIQEQLLKLRHDDAFETKIAAT